MRTYLPSLFSFILLTVISQAQVVGTEHSVNGNPHTKNVRGKIKPLFWKAEVDKQIVFVNLADVETFGVQEYAVDNVAYVRELTLSLKSRNLVRIYHVEPRNTASSMVNDTVQKIGERYLELSDSANDSRQLLTPVIKTYPVTTHKEMVEYRVLKKEHILSLFSNFEQTFLDYHAASIVAGQRQQTITSIKINSSANSDE